MAKGKKTEETFEDGMSIGDDGDSMIVNLSDVDESGNFPVVPAGVYQGVVETVEHKVSGAGNKMWVWRVQITDGGDWDKRMFFLHTVWSQQGIGRIKKILMELGVKHLLESNFDPENPEIMADLAGLECSMLIEVGTYQGKPNNNVKKIFAPEGGGSSDFV